MSTGKELRRRSRAIAASFGIVAAVAACGGSAPSPPNLVLILLDTARADRLPCYGHGRPTTPRVCDLAKEGWLFLEARAPAPWTLPSHASLFTGKTPAQHGLHWGNPRALAKQRLAVRQPDRLLATRLASAGYTTVGVSNNPWVGRLSGLSAGFDHFVEVWEERATIRERYAEWPAAWKTRAEVDHQPSGHALVAVKKLFAEEAIASPYFLFVNLLDPHMPYSPAPDLVGRFDGDATLAASMRERTGEMELRLLAGAETGDREAFANLYDEELLTADRAIGHLFEWLRARGDYDDALIVVTSDHGEHLGERGRYSHQLSMDRELLRVPLIVRFPGGRGGGRVVTQTVSLMDLYPTLLASAGVATDDDPGVALPRFAVDLAQLDRPRDRAVLAESHFSDDYLAMLSRRSPTFDAERHRAVRRTWFSGDEEHRFENDAPETASDRFRGLNERYAQSLSGTGEDSTD